MYHVRLEKFEGPLNLLLELLEAQKLDISEVSIARVAEEFLEYVRVEDRISLDHLAEFVSIASKIILIKSRSILPNLKLDTEEEKEIQDLEEQLKIYKKFKDGAEVIGEMMGDRPKMFSRDLLSGFTATFLPPQNLNAYDLKKFFSQLVDQIVIPEKIPEEAVKAMITLEEKIAELQKNLRNKIEITFADMHDSAADKVDIIVSFLAILEMVKQKIIWVEQNELFMDIKIKHHAQHQNGQP